MVTFTEAAQEKFSQAIAEAGEECVGVRFRADKVGHHTFRYQFHLLRQEDVQESDVQHEVGAFRVYLDPDTVGWTEEATIDFDPDPARGGIDIDNPAARVSWAEPVAQKVQQVLDDLVAPALAGHGGWCELVAVEGSAAHVRLGGGCQGCAGARATLKDGIERIILKEVPEIQTVVDETDHSQGASPYMQH